MLAIVLLALRGAAAVIALATLAGGLPRVVVLGLALALGAWTALLVAGGAPPALPASLVDVALVAARELALGAALGLAAALPLVAARTAGALIDLAGAARAQGPYGTLFGVLAAAVFVGIDGHVMVASGVVDSFAHVPALTSPPPDGAVLAGLAALVPAAVRLAVPWLVTAAVVQIAVGAGTRLAERSAAHVPTAAATPAALVMITATLVGTTAVGIAQLIRHVT